MSPAAFVTPPCCARPAIATMDWTLHPLDDFATALPQVNRLCLRCFQHWAGPEDAVVEYTRKEWDEHVSQAFAA